MRWSFSFSFPPFYRSIGRNTARLPTLVVGKLFYASPPFEVLGPFQENALPWTRRFLVRPPVSSSFSNYKVPQYKTIKKPFSYVQKPEDRNFYSFFLGKARLSRLFTPVFFSLSGNSSSVNNLSKYPINRRIFSLFVFISVVLDCKMF